MTIEQETSQLSPTASEELADKRSLVEWLGVQVSAAEARVERVRRQVHIDMQIRDASSPAGLDWSDLLSVPSIALGQCTLGALRGSQWLCSRAIE
jgi:hypothetical protein